MPDLKRKPRDPARGSVAFTLDEVGNVLQVVLSTQGSTQRFCRQNLRTIKTKGRLPEFWGL